MENLDKSWSIRYQEGIGEYRKHLDYIQGCSDFQTRALEELTVLRTLHAGTEYWDSYNKAIEIIKNLKA